MGLIEQAIADMKAITGNVNEFAVPMTLVSHLEDEDTATVNGLHKKVHLNYDTEGNIVSTKSASIAIQESALTDLDYPVRNDDGEVDMIGDLVTVADSTGTDKVYAIKKQVPDETFGLLVFILEDYTAE